MENQVVLIGNLTQDPVLRQTQTGKNVCTVNFAVNKSTRNPQTREFEDVLEGYFSASIWDNQALNVAQSLKKGDRAIFIGRVSIRQYPRTDGTQGTSVDVSCSEIAPSLKWGVTQFSKQNRQATIGTDPVDPMSLKLDEDPTEQAPF